MNIGYLLFDRPRRGRILESLGVKWRGSWNLLQNTWEERRGVGGWNKVDKCWWLSKLTLGTWGIITPICLPLCVFPRCRFQEAGLGIRSAEDLPKRTVVPQSGSGLLSSLLNMRRHPVASGFSSSAVSRVPSASSLILRWITWRQGGLRSQQRVGSRVSTHSPWPMLSQRKPSQVAALAAGAGPASGVPSDWQVSSWSPAPYTCGGKRRRSLSTRNKTAAFPPWRVLKAAFYIPVEGNKRWCPSWTFSVSGKAVF